MNFGDCHPIFGDKSCNDLWPQICVVQYYQILLKLGVLLVDFIRFLDITVCYCVPKCNTSNSYTAISSKFNFFPLQYLIWLEVGALVVNFMSFRSYCVHNHTVMDFKIGSKAYKSSHSKTYETHNRQIAQWNSLVVQRQINYSLLLRSQGISGVFFNHTTIRIGFKKDFYAICVSI